MPIIYSKTDVAGMVTLYNSSPDVIENITTYANQVEKLYIVDNSEQPNLFLKRSLLTTFKNVYYLSNGDNMGVGFALNVAANRAIQDGYHFLLTMDDDTRVPTGAVADMLNFLKSYNQSEQVGILSGVHKVSKWPSQFQKVLITMTSGNLINLNIFKKVGPFKEDFFIDFVDHEYGLRLNSLGFLVIELPHILLQHRLGTLKFFFFNIGKYISHSPIRSYYIIRNGLTVMHMYRPMFPHYVYNMYIVLCREIIKYIILDSRRFKRIRLIWKGWQDSKYGRLGKANEYILNL